MAIFDSLGERWFGDGEPLWLGAPPAALAHSKRTTLLKRLRFQRYVQTFPRIAELATHIASCTEGQSFLSAACPLCARAAQRKLTQRIVDRFAAIIIRDEHIQRRAVTVIPPGLQFSIGHLDKHALLRARAALRDELRAHLGLVWSAFGIDFSLNDDTARGGGIYWQPHFHGVVAAHQLPALNANLRAIYPRLPEIASPVRFVEFDGSARGASYVLKTEFVRRDAYRRKGLPHRPDHWASKPKTLPARHEVELRLFLHDLGLNSRVIVIRGRSLVELLARRRE